MLGFDALGRLALGQLPGATAGATIFEGSWHQPFNTDVVRQRTPYSAARQQFAAFVEASPFKEQWTPERFSYVALSEPSRSRKPMHEGAQQFAAFVQFRFPELVSADRWFVPFSEPVRFRRFLPTSEQPFTLIVEEPPFFESVTADRWSPSLSEPVRFRRALPASEQQFAAFVQFSPFAERVTADRWFAPFSEPVRFRPRLLTANQQFLASLGLPITNIAISMSASLLATADITGIPTSNYKMILTDTSRRLIYAAEISPWTIAR